MRVAGGYGKFGCGFVSLRRVSRSGHGRRFLVAGHIARDVHIKIRDSESLPEAFQSLFKNSTPTSEVNEVLGGDWDFPEVLAVLRKHMVAPISCSYGGRGPNVAYGAALLGAAVELIGFVGEDFDKSYPGFYDGGYHTHLRKGGVIVSQLSLTPDEIGAIDEEEHDHGVLAFRGKEVPTIYCVKDLAGTDFYLIDDVRGAHTLADRSPVPKGLVRRYDGVFITSGEPSFNGRLAECARGLGRAVFFDVGAYGTTDDHLRRMIPRCDTVLGNRYEMGLVRRAFGIKDTAELFDVSPGVSTIILEDKIACTAEIYERGKARPTKMGPVRVERRMSSVGCCDGIAAGYLGLYAQGYDKLTALKAGLLECASVWRTEGVHEGMLGKRQLFRKLMKT